MMSAGFASVSPQQPPVPSVSSTLFASTGAVGRPAVRIAGTPQSALNLVIEVLTTGAAGVATFRWSADGGSSWAASGVVVPATGVTTTSAPSYARVAKVPAEGLLALGALGLSAKFPVSGMTYTAGDRYTFVLAAPIGSPVYAGSGLAEELAKAEIDAMFARGLGGIYPVPLPDGDEGTVSGLIDGSMSGLSTLYQLAAQRWAAAAPVIVAHIQANAVVSGARVQ